MLSSKTDSFHFLLHSLYYLNENISIFTSLSGQFSSHEVEFSADIPSPLVFHFRFNCINPFYTGIYKYNEFHFSLVTDSRVTSSGVSRDEFQSQQLVSFD